MLTFVFDPLRTLILRLLASAFAAEAASHHFKLEACKPSSNA